MASDVTGLYRIRGVGNLPSDVYVTDGAMAFDMPEERYHALRYKPDFGLLPWKDEYDAAPQAADTLDRT